MPEPESMSATSSINPQLLVAQGGSTEPAFPERQSPQHFLAPPGVADVAATFRMPWDRPPSPAVAPAKAPAVLTPERDALYQYLVARRNVNVAESGQKTSGNRHNVGKLPGMRLVGYEDAGYAKEVDEIIWRLQQGIPLQTRFPEKLKVQISSELTNLASRKTDAETELAKATSEGSSYGVTPEIAKLAGSNLELDQTSMAQEFPRLRQALLDKIESLNSGGSEGRDASEFLGKRYRLRLALLTLDRIEQGIGNKDKPVKLVENALRENAPSIDRGGQNLVNIANPKSSIVQLQRDYHDDARDVINLLHQGSTPPLVIYAAKRAVKNYETDRSDNLHQLRISLDAYISDSAKNLDQRASAARILRLIDMFEYVEQLSLSDDPRMLVKNEAVKGHAEAEIRVAENQYQKIVANMEGELADVSDKMRQMQIALLAR